MQQLQCKCIIVTYTMQQMQLICSYFKNDEEMIKWTNHFKAL